ELAAVCLPVRNPPHPRPQFLFLQPHGSPPRPPSTSDASICHCSTPPLLASSHGALIRGAHPRVDPSEVGLVALEATADGVHQYGIGRASLEAAGLFKRQDPLHPPVAFLTGCPQGAFAPQHPKAQGPFRPIVRRVHPVLGKKDPEGVHLSQQTAGKTSRVI